MRRQKAVAAPDGSVWTRKDFNGTIEKRLAPKYQDGPVILRELNKLEIVLGKGDNAVAAPDGSVWKKKIGFLETTLLAISEYTPQSYPMHITKNVCANSLNTSMDMEIVALQSELTKFILAEVLKKDGVFFIAQSVKSKDQYGAERLAGLL